jgi:hypothetical protein
MKISDDILSIIMCPAVILANSRTINANGLVNILTISIGAKIIFTQNGIPGGATM